MASTTVPMTVDNGDGPESQTVQLSEIANPAAVAFRWSVNHDGFGTYMHEITWPRGTYSLLYGTLAPGRDAWSTTPISSPERFGVDGTIKGARAAVRAFLVA